jgi:hypothetical protein
MIVSTWGSTSDSEITSNYFAFSITYNRVSLFFVYLSITYVFLNIDHIRTRDTNTGLDRTRDGLFCMLPIIHVLDAVPTIIQNEGGGRKYPEHAAVTACSGLCAEPSTPVGAGIDG